jgi:surface polysaccharide O-acyltransferase-like enzyme
MSPAIGFAGILMTFMMVADQIISGYSRVDRTLSGLGWLIAALASWRGAWVGWLARLGKHSFGIYLSHALFIEGIQAAAHASGYGVSLGLDLVAMTGGFIGALLTTLLIARTPKLRWLNGD